ncbi:MAG: hypothetical protein ACKVGW_18800, partial [Verrucomicrobiia bacterium]
MDIGHAHGGENAFIAFVNLVGDYAKNVGPRIAKFVQDLFVVQLRLRRRDIQSGEVAFTNGRLVMRFVEPRGTECKDVYVAILDKEVDPIPGSLLCASNGTAVDHLD